VSCSKKGLEFETTLPSTREADKQGCNKALRLLVPGRLKSFDQVRTATRPHQFETSTEKKCVAMENRAT